MIHDVIDSMGRTQQMKFISEGNIYRLTAKSQMPKADEFESWIFDDVVPSVINTGSYSLQQQKMDLYKLMLAVVVEALPNNTKVINGCIFPTTKPLSISQRTLYLLANYPQSLLHPHPLRAYTESPIYAP